MTQIYIGILTGIICLLLLFGWAVCHAAGRASREEERRERMKGGGNRGWDRES